MRATIENSRDARWRICGRLPTLSSAAWDGALAMQALGKIGFDVARKLARIYATPANVRQFQESMRGAVLHSVSRLGGLLDRAPEAMAGRAATLQESIAWTKSLTGGFQHLLNVYDELPPEPSAGTAG